MNSEKETSKATKNMHIHVIFKNPVDDIMYLGCFQQLTINRLQQGF